MKCSEIPWRGCSVVAGASFVLFPIGLLYTYSNMIPYVASYYNKEGKQFHSADGIWFLAASIIGQGATSLVGGFIEYYIGPQCLSLIGSTLFCGGYMLTYFTIDMSFALTILTYGLTVGSGVGLCSYVPVACAMQWFPHSTGIINGVIASAIGLGGIVFIPLQTEYINPENIESENGIFTDAGIIKRTHYSFVLLGGISAVLMVIGSVLISYPSRAEQHERSLNDLDNSQENDSFNNSTLAMVNKRLTSLSPKQVIRTRNFVLIWLSYLCLIIIMNMTSGLYKVYGLTKFNDDLFMAIVGSASLVFNAIGRLVWGYLFDKFTYRTSMMIMSLAQTMVIATFVLTPLLGRFVFGAWVVIMLFGEACTFVSVPALINKIWGPEFFLYNLGIVATSLSVGGLLCALTSSLIITAIGYEGAFAITALAALITFVLTYFIDETDISSSNTQGRTGVINDSFE